MSDTERPKTQEQAQEAKPNAKTDSQLVDALSLTSSLIFENIKQILSKFGISNELGKQIKYADCITLRKMESTNSPQEIVFTFFTRLMSNDYRSVLLFTNSEPIEYLPKIKEVARDLKSSITKITTKKLKLSCRDMIFAILNCCDPFLMQEVLSKMTHCQLAVPVLLPSLDHSKVLLLLWGLLRITKVWKNPVSNEVQEKFVVKHPFPTVSVLRLGNIDISKSNILNKMLGPIQNNDDHPYFLSCEQDSAMSILSQGTVEGIWFLPSSVEMGQYSFRESTCFLNVRGDAEKLHSQRKFVAKFSTLNIVFIAKSNIPSKKHIIREISTTSRLVLVLCGHGDISNDLIDEVAGMQVTVLDAHRLKTLDIGKRLCTEVNVMHSLQGSRSIHCLEDFRPICSDLRIDVDIMDPPYYGARKAVQDILNLRIDKIMKNKFKSLPFQENWKFWATHTRNRISRTITDGDTERYIAEFHQAEDNFINEQRTTPISTEIQKLYRELLHPNEKYRQSVVISLQQILDESSSASLKPLVDKETNLRCKVREISNSITCMNQKLNYDKTITEKEREQIEKTLKELSKEESQLLGNIVFTSEELASRILGFEHFLSEFGQMYECYHNYRNPDETFTGTLIDVKPLPRMAGELLLNGYPLEILNGYAHDIPIKWVRGVLSAVIDRVGDSRIYVITIIGMQSTGKSTLLNSMFGIRVKEGAARCTRGMFLYFVPIDDELKETLGCDFIAVIDMEGLKEHSKLDRQLRKRNSELATLALCISDMTIVNCVTDTVNEGLLNILQISAHTFIRMKEINTPSSCYFIEQFVPGVMTSGQNRISMQSIIQTLDEAIEMAANEEGMQDKYKKFSDCFTILNTDDSVDDILFVPDLWRTQNYRYSETSLQIKSALLTKVMQKHKKQTMSEFAGRIAKVWKALAKEDFVYKFCNTTDTSLICNFTLSCMRGQLKFLQEMMQFGLDAKKQIRATPADSVNNRRSSLVKELDKKLSTEGRKMRTACKEQEQDWECEVIKHHLTRFDIWHHRLSRLVRDTIDQMLTIESSIITKENTKTTQLLTKIKEKLGQQVLLVTKKLEETLHDCNLDSQKAELTRRDTEIERVFNVEWSNLIKDVQRDNATDSDKDIKQNTKRKIRKCLIESFEGTGWCMEVKQLLLNQKLEDLCSSSPDISTVDDIHDATTSVRTCSRQITEYLRHIYGMLKEKFSSDGFVFSTTFLESLKVNLRHLVVEPCYGCKKTELLVCLACNILYQAYKATLNNTLSRMKDMFLQVLKDTLPKEVSQILESMREEDIQKHAYIPLLQLRHVLDRGFLFLVPHLSTPKYDQLLCIIADSQELFLQKLLQHRVYDEIIVKSVITSTLMELVKHKELAKAEQALTIAFICSWGLPICQALQITFAKQQCIQVLLEQERDDLYSDFRNSCLAAYKDHLAAMP